jgi:hypothetical protein
MTVNGSGLVAATGAGPATVSASVGGKSGSLALMAKYAFADVIGGWLFGMEFDGSTASGLGTLDFTPANRTDASVPGKLGVILTSSTSSGVVPRIAIASLLTTPDGISFAYIFTDGSRIDFAGVVSLDDVVADSVGEMNGRWSSTLSNGTRAGGAWFALRTTRVPSLSVSSSLQAATGTRIRSVSELFRAVR